MNRPQYAYVVVEISPDHSIYVCGVYPDHETAKPVALAVVAGGCEAEIIQWEIGGRRVACWSYDKEHGERYYIYPIRE